MNKRITILCLSIVSTLVLIVLLVPSPPEARQSARYQSNCGHWHQAIICYDKALSINPKDAVSLARRGFAKFRIGNLKQAMMDIEGAITLDTNCADAYSRRSHIYNTLGLNHLAREDAHRALELIKEVPVNPDLLAEYAGLLDIIEKKQEACKESKKVINLIGQSKDLESSLIAVSANGILQQYQDSINRLNNSIRLDPNNFYLYYLRGASYWHLNDLEKAQADFDSSLKLNNKNPLSLWGKANFHYCQGRYKAAIEEFSKSIKLAPNLKYAFYWRGLAYRELNEFQKAIEDLTYAIKLNPTDSFSYMERARTYCKMKDWKRALIDTQKALSIDPENLRVYTVQAWAKDESGHFSKAVEDYNKAIASSSSGESFLYYGRGMLFRKHKQYDKAIEDISKAIELNPNDPISYCARGSALVSVHQYKRAISDCSKSLELDPNRAHPHLSRGISYAKLGQEQLAIKDFDEAIRQHPDYGEAYFERALAYRAIGKESLSNRDLEKAKEYGHQSPEAMR